MGENKKNDWEATIDLSKMKECKDFNLDSVYERAHSELSLQQSKRDQIITIYLALCSFLIPFALGEEIISFSLKGVLFIIIAIIGILFSVIAVRYREYKEVYWLCCQTITVMQNIKPEEINKSTIQSVFYHCLAKKGKGYLQNGKINKLDFVKKNIFSAETLHFVIIVIMTSFISGLGVALFLYSFQVVNIVVGVLVGLLVFILLLAFYFYTCIKIYSVLEIQDSSIANDNRDKMFSKIFGKAWFLHMYYDA